MEDAFTEVYIKQALREEVWRRLTAKGVVRFPGAYGRIPNFVGAEEAARRAMDLPEVKSAKVVFVNPESPQYPLRTNLLLAGKILILNPSKSGGSRTYLLLDPENLKPHPLRLATLKGALHYGKRLALEELPEIDLFVTGCIGVTPRGERLGREGDLTEQQYALLLWAGRITPKTPVLTTVHELQILPRIPAEKHELRIDLIVTPERVIRTGVSRETLTLTPSLLKGD